MGYALAIIGGIAILVLLAVVFAGARGKSEGDTQVPESTGNTGQSYDEPQDEGTVEPMAERREPGESGT